MIDQEMKDCPGIAAGYMESTSIVVPLANYSQARAEIADLKMRNTITELAQKHNKWLVEMGWNKTNPLEQLALIASEVGEAVNECRGEKPTDKLGSELADIILRTMGMAEQFGINIEKEIVTKMALNLSKGNFKDRLK